jgi:molecular chaperone DnaK
LGVRIVEDLPLREGAFNDFTLKLFDAQGNPVPLDFGPIQIAQGRYSIAGQMLGDDISLVWDDRAANDTRAKLLLRRNTVLPTKAKTTVGVAETVIRGSDKEVLIMVVEGPADRHPSTNQPIGVLTITGRQIARDLIRGTEIDLSFEMSESRDL